MRLRLLPALAVLLAGCSTAPTSRVERAPPPDVAPVTQAPAEPRATDLLALLPVRNQDPVGYRREMFGSPWADVDGNHCDTRNDVLARDMVDEVLRGDHCTVESGVLHDPYTGRELTFTRGAATSSAVQIDHVSSLADAYRSGANTWTPQRRLAYANDPANLLAVSGKVNQSKGDKTADEWRPPLESFGCRFAGITVAVKVKYLLSVSEPERVALAELLRPCPEEPAVGAGVDTP